MARAPRQDPALMGVLARRPLTVEDTLTDLTDLTRVFLQHHDYRAVFAHAYLVTTRELRDAIHQRGEYTRDPRVFLNPTWVSTLTGFFASEYLKALEAYENDREMPRCWRNAHDAATRRRGAVVEDLVLGINAHIVYDLPYAAYRAISPGATSADLRKHRFDHEQVNNILVRAIPKVITNLGQYGLMVRLADSVLKGLDDRVAATFFRFYRNQVWPVTLALHSVRGYGEQVAIVRGKTDWEANRQAAALLRDTPLRRVLLFPGRTLRFRSMHKVMV